MLWSWLRALASWVREANRYTARKKRQARARADVDKVLKAGGFQPKESSRG
jgi:hypothetical protein